MSQQYQQPHGSGSQGSFGGQTSQQPQSMGGSQGGQQPMGQSQGGGGQMGTGSQTGQSHRTSHQQVGQQFESELTPELNEALETFDRVVEIASWCADKCMEMGPEMAECARLCNDLADLAELNEKLIARDSINGPEIAEAYLRVAQQGIPILQQYQQSPHVQETLQAVQQSIDKTNTLLASISGQRQQGFQELAQQEQFQQGGMGQQSQPQSQQFPGSQSY